MSNPVRFDPAQNPSPDCRVAPPEGKVLCLAPHPDDEVMAVGGTLHLHHLQDDPVRIVIATDGRSGDPEERFEPQTYPERRRQESRKATELLGLEEPVFLSLPDSCVITESDLLGLSQVLAQQLRDYQPDIVYMPWELDGNSDHMALHHAAMHALREVQFAGAVWGYEVWAPMPSPAMVIDITIIADRKRRALQHYVTQMAYWDLEHFMDGLSAYRALLIPKNRGYAEAFGRIEV